VLQWKSLEGVRQASASTTGRSPAAIDVTRSEYRMAVSMSAGAQDNSDIPAMEAEATKVAVAIEALGRTEPELAGIQNLSVAFVHQHGTSDAHTDDVFSFRRQSNGAFKYNAL
jgi:hypothetical protein